MVSSSRSIARGSVGVFLSLALSLMIFWIASSSGTALGAEECSGNPEIFGSSLVGTDCDDVIIAQKRVTEILGGGGDDEIIAGGDIELVDGGSGNDIIVGTDAVEELKGGSGNDRIFGDDVPPAISLEDLLSDDASHYVLEGSEDNDHDLWAKYDDSPGEDDRITGGSGNDWVWGQRGNDRIWGGEGYDRLFAGVGDDLAVGDEGNDLLSGGNGNDNVIGGDGNDLVRGDTVLDTRETVPQGSDLTYSPGLRGGNGVDTLSFATAVTPGFRTIDLDGRPDPSVEYGGFPAEGGERGVYVDLTDLVALNGASKDGGGNDLIGDDFENVVGSPFSDYIRGTNGNNVIVGGGGADVLIGEDGNDRIFGGADGDFIHAGPGADYVRGETKEDTTTSSNRCEGVSWVGDSSTNCTRTSGGVVVRPTNLLSAGLTSTGWASGEAEFTQAYVLGTTGSDSITTSFDPDNRKIIFTSTGTTLFDMTIKAGCGYSPDATTAACIWEDAHPMDAILYYGGDNGDNLRASTSTVNLHSTITPYILGGNGSDWELHGSNTTEDVIIDGPDDGNDRLKGFGQTDVLYQGKGTDNLDAGLGGDVLYSTRTCEANVLNGGSDASIDNVTWAAFILPNRSKSSGVHASLYWGLAGDRNVWGVPDCAAGSSFRDTLSGIDNLEGSNGQDVLIGNAEPNTLLGRAGADFIQGLEGNDRLHTFSDDYDSYIDCGTGVDEIRMDAPREDQRDGVTPTGCNDGVNSIKPRTDSEYQYAIDRTVIGGIVKKDQWNPSEVFYRFGERAGDTAYASDPASENINGAYAGGVTFGAQGAIPDTEDTAIALDGVNDWINLGDPSNIHGAHAYDPASRARDSVPYSNTGYSFEIWARFDGVLPTAGLEQYILSKTPSTMSTGFYLYRSAQGNLVFGTAKAANNRTEVTAPDPEDFGVWHQIVGTLSKDVSGSNSKIRLFVDGVLHEESASGSAFPGSATSAGMWVGRSPNSSGWLKGTVDSLAIYPWALSQCQVSQHFSLRTAGAEVLPKTC